MNDANQTDPAIYRPARSSSRFGACSCSPVSINVAEKRRTSSTVYHFSTNRRKTFARSSSARELQELAGDLTVEQRRPPSRSEIEGPPRRLAAGEDEGPPALRAADRLAELA